MFFAALWAWTDFEIRKLQPYVELARGNAPPQRSLLLDYTRNKCAFPFSSLLNGRLIGYCSTLLVWTVAARNRHWPVVLGALLVVLTFSFQPLAAALFNVQDISLVQHGASTFFSKRTP